VLGTGLLVPALVFGWLAWRGGFEPFVAILTGYVLPLYGHVGRVSVMQAFTWYAYGRLLWGLLAILGLLAVLGPVPEGARARRALALLGAGYGWLHFWAQGKGWEYHLYPLALFVCALVPFALVRLSSRRSLAPALRRWASLTVFSAAVVVLGFKGVDALDAPWIADKAQRVEALTHDLARLVPPGGTVQVMDVTAGGIQALLRLGIREPTRFIYDFHFFHDVADPRIQALGREFVSGLETAPPAAIVVMLDSWNRPGYDRLREVPGLEALLDHAYVLAVEGDGYRIYEKRPRS